jgi:3-methyladenine DNA glycosylase AlkD
MPKRTAARAPLGRAVAEEVRAFCQSKADPKLAARWARFFTEGYDAYGVDYKDPAWKGHQDKWVERLRTAGPTAFLDAGDVLVESGKYEEASFAILFAKGLPEFHTPAAFKRIGKWFEGGIRNWGHTDVLCSEVLGRFLVERIVSVDDLTEWRGSTFKFKRRAVPVTLIKVLEAADIARLLAFVEPLMHDQERVVQQGVGWFLREAWKRKPKLVEALLLKHKNTAPRLIYQYATEKMTAEAKARFRKAK